MKRMIKYYLKNSRVIFGILTGTIFIYLKFAYFTSRWRFILPSGFNQQNLKDEKGVFFALWHNRLAYGMRIFQGYQDMYGLASPHSDGKILGRLVRMMNHQIIEGSTNKNSAAAIKEILRKLDDGDRIVVTPDGPRGPLYNNGSVITKIAAKYNRKIFPVSCQASSYFELGSWDKMMLPKPFSSILVIIGEPLVLSGKVEKDRLLLETRLNELTAEAKSRFRSGL